METRHADWRDEAACLHADPDLFFPVGTAGPALRQVDAAKRICRACPVRAPCLAWALGQGILSGVWGGTTEEERRAMQRRLSHVPVNDWLLQRRGGESSQPGPETRTRHVRKIL